MVTLKCDEMSSDHYILSNGRDRSTLLQQIQSQEGVAVGVEICPRTRSSLVVVDDVMEVSHITGPESELDTTGQWSCWQGGVKCKPQTRCRGLAG